MQVGDQTLMGSPSPCQKENVEIARRMLFFYPTRFHIFDQLDTPVFENVEFEIYSVYPQRFFREGRFKGLRRRNHTLWGALGLRCIIALGSRLRVSPSIMRFLRSWYFKVASAEFAWRTRSKAPALIVGSSGYLGHWLNRMCKRGHRVIVNHGSLYEPWVRAQMTSLGNATNDQTANWSHSALISRMDREFESAEKIIVCSPTARESFPQKIRERVLVVPLGAPLLQHRRGLRGEGANFLHVSNLSFSKNCISVLDAFEKIRTPKDRLILVGPAPKDAALRRRLENTPSGVEWRGRQNRIGVSDAMAEADILVHPSFADGWGMVITEALGSGLCIIASPQTGAATYYAPLNPRTITLVDPTNVNDIARSMREMAERLSQSPDLVPYPPMSWDESAKKLLEALEPLRKTVSNEIFET